MDRSTEYTQMLEIIVLEGQLIQHKERSVILAIF
jgi:hypothetical protein